MVKRKADKVASLTAAENSFEVVARKWWSHWKPGRSEQHAAQVMRRFEANVFPHIGKRPVAQIRAPELVAMRNGVTMTTRTLALGGFQCFAQRFPPRLVTTTVQI